MELMENGWQPQSRRLWGWMRMREAGKICTRSNEDFSLRSERLKKRRFDV